MTVPTARMVKVVCIYFRSELEDLMCSPKYTYLNKEEATRRTYTISIQ